MRRWIRSSGRTACGLAALLAAAAMTTTTARANDCPGQGPCCLPNFTPGCDDVECCETVCALDPWCCEILWGPICAGIAKLHCDLCAVSACPGEGDCCEPNGTPGCQDLACCELICTIDPFCCDTEWDAICVGLAEHLCEDCLRNEVCPGEGDCLEANGSPGCDNVACCEQVCAIDPFCCDVEWDQICADEAFDVCLPEPAMCPGAGSCFEANGSPSCELESCCALICFLNTYCCNVDWDQDCADAAIMACKLPCPGPGGDCFNANGTPGCDDKPCCTVVCQQDLYCCQVEWDLICAAAAVDLCQGGGGGCPGEGSCFEDNGSPGCDDVDCCELVCGIDPFCCDIAWDGVCAGEAMSLCGPPVTEACCFADGTCADLDVDECAVQGGSAQGAGTACAGVVCPVDPCPGEGDCFVPNGTPGCDDEACCEIVCADDPFCCDVEWDQQCADEADALCGGPPCPGEGDCFIANGTPGCEDEKCCTTVCVADPFCCETEWDQICADQAADLCTPTCCTGAEMPEPEDCGQDTNGGCNADPPVYTPAECPISFCGTAWAEGGMRDTDWYLLSLPQRSEITATARTSFTGVVFVVSGIDTCKPEVAGTVGDSAGCIGGTASAVVDAGNYAVFVATAVFEGFPCGGGQNEYAVEIDCVAIPPECAGGLGDTDGDGFVGVTDLLNVISDFGCTQPPGPCVGDANGDGLVDVQDVTAVIVNWGPCG